VFGSDAALIRSTTKQCTHPSYPYYKRGTALANTNNDENISLSSEVKSLKDQATRARLEAEKMQVDLTFRKISDLEDKLSKNGLNSDESASIQMNIDKLKKILDPDYIKVEKKPAPVPRDSQVGKSKDNAENKEVGLISFTEEEGEAIKLWASLTDHKRRVFSVILEGSDLDWADAETFVRIIWRRNKDARNVLADPENALWTMFTNGDDSAFLSMLEIENSVFDVEALAELSTDTLEKRLKNVRNIVYGLGRISAAIKEDPESVQEGASVEELQLQVLEEMEALMAMETLVNKGVNDDDVQMWTDPNNRPIFKILPDSMRKPGKEPSQDDVDIIFNNLISLKVFRPDSRPQKVPGGFIIRGDVENQANGDSIISSLDDIIEKCALQTKVQCYYILDPFPPNREEIDSALSRAFEEMDESILDGFEKAVILVASSDTAPEFTWKERALASSVGVACISYFSVMTCYGGDFSFGHVLSLLGPVLFIQFAHELGHRAIAWKDNIDVSPPTVTPGVLGTYGSNNALMSPPKDRKSLFDFAISGPLVGIITSVAVLFGGLFQTSSATAAVSSTFPNVSVDFLRISALASEILSNVVGGDILLTPDPVNTLVGVHPWVIAGYIGILTNGLSLLPLGTTDGGRIATAVAGKYSTEILRDFCYLTLCICGFFGYDESQVLVLYAFFLFIGGANDPELPCRNEVDDIDVPRAMIGAASLILAGLASFPLK